MRLTDEQRDEFERLVRPLVKWLNDNTHPHASVVITPTSAEVLEGIAVVRTTEYVKD